MSTFNISLGLGWTNDPQVREFVKNMSKPGGPLIHVFVMEPDDDHTSLTGLYPMIEGDESLMDTVDRAMKEYPNYRITLCPHW